MLGDDTVEIKALCERLAKILKLPIREYRKDAVDQYSLKTVYGNFNAVPNSLADDYRLLKEYHQQKNKDLPLLIMNNGGWPSAVVSDNEKRCYFIIGKIKTMNKHKEVVSLGTDFEALAEAALLIHEWINGEHLSMFELLSSDIDLVHVQNDLREKIGETSFDYQEMGELHNPYDQELREQTSIREGDYDRLMRSFHESYAGRLATLSKDSLRARKNLGIVVVAISTRSAIEGGLHPEQAFLLSDSYILKIDEAQTQDEIYQIIRGAEIHFTQLVFEAKAKIIENPLVLRTKSIIFKKLHDKVKLKEIAEELQTAPTYLAAVFKKETGMTIHTFIIKEKLKVAENLLIYSDYSIEEIANYLAFSSQSHFGNLFKRHYHFTPNRYRLKFGAQKEQ